MTNKTFLLKLGLVLGLVFLPAITFADVQVQFDNYGNATTSPGTSLIVNGTVTNTSTSPPVYFNSLSNLFLISQSQIATSSTDTTFADANTSFNYLPITIAPTMSYQGPLVKLTIGATTQAGDYWGTYNLLGGSSISATSSLATRVFVVHVVSGAAGSVPAATSTPSGLTIPGGASSPGSGSGLQIPSGGDQSGVTAGLNNYESGPRLIKLDGDSTVYWVSENNIKIPMLSDKVFYSYHNKMSDVVTVAQDEFDYYQSAKYIWLNGTGAIYYINNGVKRIIPSSVWNQLEADPSEIINVNKTDFNSYSKGASITSPDDVQ